jgi:hypothetical protein
LQGQDVAAPPPQLGRRRRHKVHRIDFDRLELDLAVLREEGLTPISVVQASQTAEIAVGMTTSLVMVLVFLGMNQSSIIL